MSISCWQTGRAAIALCELGLRLAQHLLNVLSALLHPLSRPCICASFCAVVQRDQIDVSLSMIQRYEPVQVYKLILSATLYVRPIDTSY